MRQMSEEAKAKIAASVRAAFARKRAEKEANGGIPLGVPAVLKTPPSTVKMSGLTFDPSLFIPIKTGKSIDKLFSADEGLTRATNFMVVGDPGVGKSTVMMDVLSDLKTIAKARTLFISGEMDRVDLYGYVKRYPKFGDLDILFLGDYIEENPKLVIEEILQNGYDVVLLDSFVEVQDTVKSALGMSTGNAEKWLVDLMREHNAGKNKTKTYTTFLAIQQVTKGGNFVGSNKLKHNTTGMLEMRFEEDGSRYLMFAKNRRGDVNKKMYFEFKDSGDVEYDVARFDLDETARDIIGNEKDSMKADSSNWEKVFGEPIKDDKEE